MNPAVRQARLRGAREAERLLSLLEVRERLPATNERVDVYGALAWLDVRVIFKPLEGLIGAYVRGDTPGIMISTRRPPSVQRFTAAHELGHAVMDHAPSLDSPGVLSNAASGRPRPLIHGFASYLQEVEADAFAGGFLLPPWLITRHARRQNWTREHLQTPEVVYQLSLRCGASFQAVAWALERNRFISPADRTALLKTKPRDLKARLGHGARVADTRNDAWWFSANDAGLDFELVVGDTINLERVCEATWEEVIALEDFLTPVRTGFDEESQQSACFLVSRRGAASLHLQGSSAPTRNSTVGFVAFDRESGLSRANRARLASAAGQGGVDCGA